MAEDDWYAELKRYFEIVTGIAGGLFFAISGLMGYDLGKRSYGPGIEPRTRWVGHILWLDVAIGLGFLAWGLWRLRTKPPTK